MAFVQFSQVSLAFGDRDILSNVTINLHYFLLIKKVANSLGSTSL